MIYKIIQDAYNNNITASENKAKDDASHQRRDLDMIVEGLKGLSEKETRIAAMVIVHRYSNHLPHSAQEKLLQIAFDADMKEISRVIGKVVGIMDRCSERPTHQRVSNPLASLVSFLNGGAQEPNEDDEEDPN